MGPTFKLKKKVNKTNKHNKNILNQFSQAVRRLVIFLKFFSFKSSLFDSQSSDRRISSGQTRKVLYVTRATRGNKKKQDFTENSGTILEKS